MLFRGTPGKLLQLKIGKSHPCFSPSNIHCILWSHCRGFPSMLSTNDTAEDKKIVLLFHHILFSELLSIVSFYWKNLVIIQTHRSVEEVSFFQHLSDLYLFVWVEQRAPVKWSPIGCLAEKAMLSLWVRQMHRILCSWFGCFAGIDSLAMEDLQEKKLSNDSKRLSLR